MSFKKALAELLAELFTLDELRRFLKYSPDGDQLVASLPPSALAALADNAVSALSRFGRLDDAFFDRLVEERAGREDDIRGVRRLWVLETASMEAEERVNAAGRKAEQTGARVESRIAKRAVLWAGVSSLLVALIAAATLIGLFRTRSELEQVIRDTEAQSKEFHERLEEVRQAALAAQRVSERPPEVAPLAAPRLGDGVGEPEAASAGSASGVSLQQPDDARPRMGGKLWPVGHTLRVRFLGGTPEQHRQVEQWVGEWLEHANLRLEFSGSEDAEVRIAFEEGAGSWSYVGIDALNIPQDSPTMNLGWLDRGTVLKEFGYVLGFIREHQNPNANIAWNEAVIADLAGPPNFWNRERIHREILRKMDPDRYAGYRTFDPDSVMMIPISGRWTRDGRGFAGNASELSQGDKEFAARLYPPAG